MSHSHVPKRRIITHKDENTASLVQKGELYAFGPLYEQVAGEANIGAEQDVLQRINPDAKAAWEYFIKRTRLEPDLMRKIRGVEHRTDGNPNVEQARDDHISNVTEQATEARAQGSETGMGQNSGWEGNVPEIRELTPIDEEYTGGDENVTELVQSNQNTTAQTEGDQNVIQEENIIEEYCFSKIGEVIEEAMSAYDGIEMQESDFKNVMITHGCLFLLQMFFFLGLKVDKLENEDELHEFLFGRDENGHKNRRIKFSKSMLIPGNQIPLVVLNKLIQHSFFKKVALKKDWKKTPSSHPLKSVLYDLILDPAVLKTNRSSSSTYTDVLHGLHCRCVGPARGKKIVEESRGHQNGNVDLEVGINSRNYLDPKDGEGQRIPSATTMYSKGIYFKAVSGMLAIRKIQIKDGVFIGKELHLPVFHFNEMMKEIYKSLKAYENDQGLRQREVSDYLRFMCDIVRTDQDAALLELKGVIKCHSEVLIDEVAGYLAATIVQEVKDLEETIKCLKEEIFLNCF
nr:uncharacterized protein LOC109176010 [Ipomoea batatas]